MCGMTGRYAAIRRAACADLPSSSDDQYREDRNKDCDKDCDQGTGAHSRYPHLSSDVAASRVQVGVTSRAVSFAAKIVNSIRHHQSKTNHGVLNSSRPLVAA